MMQRLPLLTTFALLSIGSGTVHAQQPKQFFAPPVLPLPIVDAAQPPAIYIDIEASSQQAVNVPVVQPAPAAGYPAQFSSPATVTNLPQPAAVVQTAAQSAPSELRYVSPIVYQPQVAPPNPQAAGAMQLPTPPTAAAVEPGSMSSYDLTELEGFAITYNPILRREQAQIEAAKGDRVQAALYPNPAMETNNPEVWAGKASYVNFGFQQDIIVKGKLRLDKAAADQVVHSNTAAYRLERARMLTEVRKQYYEALAAKHRVYLAQHLATIAERGLSGAKQLEKAGEGTLTDVLLLDTEFQLAQVRLQNANTVYQGELRQLAAVVGMPQIVINDVEGTLFNAPPQFNEQDVQRFLTTASSYMEKARADIVRSKVLLRRAEVEPYPNIRTGPSYQTGTVTNSSQFWLTVEFDIPVWNLNQGNIRKTNAEVQIAEADIDIVRNELNRKTSELFANHQAAKFRADRIRTMILPNAQRTLDLVQDAYVKGEFEVNRLLQTQHNLAEVSSEYFEAAEEAWTTAAELAGMLQMEQFP